MPDNTDPAAVTDFVALVANVSQAIGWQANVGAMETAGSIISYLARHPELIPEFIANPSVIDWPFGWHTEGCLTWHAQDGKIHDPEFLRRQSVIDKMKSESGS